MELDVRPIRLVSFALLTFLISDLLKIYSICTNNVGVHCVRLTIKLFILVQQLLFSSCSLLIYVRMYYSTPVLHSMALTLATTCLKLLIMRNRKMISS